jgi:hypothetical protein
VPWRRTEKKQVLHASHWPHWEVCPTPKRNGIKRDTSKHSDASFSHGICPECALKFYESEGMEVPEEVLKDAEKRNYD